MTQYRLQISPKAEKELAAIRVEKDLLRLQAAIYKLAEVPRPPGCLKLAGAVDQWRIRVGDWRVAYAVQDGALVVLEVTVAVRGGGGVIGGIWGQIPLTAPHRQRPRVRPGASGAFRYSRTVPPEGRARTEGWARSARPVGAVRALPGAKGTGRDKIKLLNYK